MPIAIYHLSIKIISHGKGHSAVAASQMEKCGIRTERGNINREAERIRTNVYNILKQEQREHKPRMAQDMEL